MNAKSAATLPLTPRGTRCLTRAPRIREICARHGTEIGAAALQFTLRHPAVTSAPLGARTPDEITADAGYLTAPVPAALFGELQHEGLIGNPR